MDIGSFRGQRGAADGKGDLRAMGVEKLNAYIAERIAQSDGFKGIPVSRVAGMIDTTALSFIQKMRCSLSRTPICIAT
jgi:hypothetical protein